MSLYLGGAEGSTWVSGSDSEGGEPPFEPISLSGRLCGEFVVPPCCAAALCSLTLLAPPSPFYTQWLDACLALQQQAKSATSPGAVTVLSLPLAAITGASSLFDRERSAEEAAKREAVAGEKEGSYGQK